MKEEIFKKNAQIFAVKIARNAYLNGLSDIIPQAPIRKDTEYLIKFMTKKGVDWPVAFKLKEDGQVKISEIFNENCGSKILADIAEYRDAFGEFGFESASKTFKKIILNYLKDYGYKEKDELSISSSNSSISSLDK